MQGRPPHGGRGLKYCVHVRRGHPLWSPPLGGGGMQFSLVETVAIPIASLPARGAWIEMPFCAGK